jgi:hypothetical protein
MAILPGGFSPWQAIQQIADDANPFDGGSRDRDIFSQKYNQRGVTPVAPNTSPNPGSAQPAPGNDAGSGQYSGGYSGGSNGGGGSAYSARDTQLQFQDQIDQINRLLGNIGVQRDQGNQRLESSFNDQNARLSEQEAKAMADYDQQQIKNGQQKQRGVEQVDNFANNSYNSLQALLRGGNAANSSVGRSLVPQLVSKSAGTRRQGVFDTAGENEQAIVSARGDAKDQFGYSKQDLMNQKRAQQEQFMQGILGQEQDLLGKRGGLESQRAAATGAGYEAARNAAAGTRGEIDSRTAQLNALFGQFAPTFNARAVNLKTPELSQFQVDQAQIRGDQSTPGETRAYLPALKKRQQEMGI